MFKRFKLKVVGFVSAVSGAVVALPGSALAEYTPLITSGDFTGIQTDVSTAVTGIISISLIILGATILLRAFRG